MTRKKQELDDLYASRFKLWRQLVNIGDIVRGSVVVLRRPCVNPGCKRCASGEKHPAVYLSISRKGKTELVYLHKDLRDRVEQMVENYRELQRILEQICQINVQIIRRLGKELSQRKENRQ
jgi:hypothetical protein